jgi:hypothetical protein
MDTIEIAELKGKILTALYEHPNQKENIEILFDSRLKLKIPFVEYEKYIIEMEQEALLSYAKGSGELYLAEKGQNVCLKGGYFKLFHEKLAIIINEERIRKLSNEKLELEVKKLKNEKWIPVIALIISLVLLSIKILEWLKVI